MLLRDPVHGLIAFENDSEQVVMKLLATREVQRLRHVRQLGLTSLVFPGAEHSRFAHALGAAHVMVRLAERIRQAQTELEPSLRLNDEHTRDAIAAALLHDVGHGPFSHSFEQVMPNARHHEAWTLDLLQDPSTDVHRALEALSRGMAERVCSLLSANHPLGYLSRALSGTLDVDRCDYMLRDSHMTGVGYGLYDLDWLLRALAFGQVPLPEGPEWVLAVEGRKGLPPIEGFFLARQFMYQQVYHHKATRAAESLIRGIFARFAELVREGRPPQGAPVALLQASLDQRVDLRAYLTLDDTQLLACFRAWEQDRDPVLAGLCEALAARKLPKTLPLPPDFPEAARRECLDRARDVAKNHGFRPDISVWLDVADDVPYQETVADPARAVWVMVRHQPIQRLGDMSFVLGELRNKRIERPRLIFPEAIRQEVIAALEPWLES